MSQGHLCEVLGTHCLQQTLLHLSVVGLFNTFQHLGDPCMRLDRLTLLCCGTQIISNSEIIAFLEPIGLKPLNQNSEAVNECEGKQVAFIFYSF